jgi:hypothetical protein
MLKVAAIVSVALVLCSPAFAADYKCAEKGTAVALNNHDIAIAKREANIAEMKAEIHDSGGATEDQQKVLKSIEDKLAKMKDARGVLVNECSQKPAP